MGTHSLIIMRVKSKDGTYQIWAVLYQQLDGYFDGVGRILVEFLSGMIITNGIAFGEKRKTANGPGCLFAQIVALFKKEVGSAYLQPPVEDVEEYNYYVDVTTDNKIEITLKSGDDTAFKGSPEEAENFLKNYIED